MQFFCYGKSCIFMMWQMMHNSPSVKKLHIFDTLWTAFFLRIRNFAYFCFLSRFFSFEKVRGGRLFHTRFSLWFFHLIGNTEKDRLGNFFSCLPFLFPSIVLGGQCMESSLEKPYLTSLSSDKLIISHSGTEDFSQK